VDGKSGIKHPSTIRNQPSTLSPALDVLIIGAGAAGLAAARQLHGAGASVLVVEARHRMGGRILTHRVDTNDLPLELGAEFVHGRPPAIFDLIEAAGLPALEVSGDRVFSEGGALRALDDFWQIVTRIDEQIDPRANLSYDQFLKSVRASAFHKKIAKSYVEGFNAARAGLISAASVAIADWAAQKIEGHRQFRLLSGYDSIIRELARVLPQECIRLEHIVREVRWAQGKVEVRCLCGGEEIRFSARRLITTLPLALLRMRPEESGGISFDPPLTAKADALARREVGNVMKVIMHFRERFWEDPRVVGETVAFGFSLCLDAAFPTFWTNQAIRENVLVGWAGGPPAEKLIGHTSAEIRAAAILSVSKTFGISAAKVGSQLVKIQFHDWSTDPFALGAYSYPGVGDLGAPQKLAEPLDGTLFFAGEATDDQGANGTVHGAIESGYRAAREILAEK
jgi:monoamine oxidase